MWQEFTWRSVDRRPSSSNSSGSRHIEKFQSKKKEKVALKINNKLSPLAITVYDDIFDEFYFLERFTQVIK